MFKALVYPRKNLIGGAIANLDIINGIINEDLTQTAVSSLKCIEIPKVVSQNDILRVYDTKGKFNYWGVINALSSNELNANQFQSLFNDNIMMPVPADAQKPFFQNVTISQLMSAFMAARAMGYVSTAFNDSGLTDIIDKDVADSYKGITFSDYDLGEERYPYPTENQIVNIEDMLYEMFNTYNRIIIPTWTSRNLGILTAEDDTPILTENSNNILTYRRIGIAGQHINILTCNPTGIIRLDDGSVYDFTEKTLFDTYRNIRNLSITKEDEDVNTVHIYTYEGVRRGSYTVDVNGEVKEITNNTSVSNRLGTNKTSYIFDDENEIMDLVKNELPTLQYNHKITFDILFDEKNKFDNYLLGQPIRFYENKTNTLYNSLLTARSYEINENSDVIKEATFTLGKVRTSLTSKLHKQ